MGEQLGLQGLIIPEEFGGSGYSYVELDRRARGDGPGAAVRAVLLDRRARRQHAAARRATTPPRRSYLPGIAVGRDDRHAGLHRAERAVGRGRHHDATATKSGDGYTLNGTKMFVLDGHTADLILVAARTDAGVSLFAVDGDAAGLTRTRCRRWTRPASRPSSSSTTRRPRCIGTEGDGWAVPRAGARPRRRRRWPPSRSAAPRRCLEMAVEYAKVRVQFGRPIGSFQAIKHKCADMLLEVESAKSAAYYAGWCAVGDERRAARRWPRLAKAYCSEAYFHAAAENIQIHGGIGFTWEHPAHLYFKRAKSSELLFGDPTYHRELLAQRIGI